MEGVPVLSQAEQHEGKRYVSQFDNSNRSCWRAARSSNPTHNQARQSPWMDSRHNPPWVDAELRMTAPEFRTVRRARKAYQGIMDSIKACGRQKDLRKGSRVHADILKTGLLKTDIYIGTALVRMYARCGALAKAQEVFDGLAVRNVVCWNALIAGYAQHGLGEDALNCFVRMRDEGFSPDAVTFISVLKACGSIGATEKGEEIHGEVRRLGLLENHDIVLGNALMSMYAKCGALDKAQQVFDGLVVRDTVSWNVLIAGYAQHMLNEQALNCFGQMRDEGFSPDAVTFISVLKACGSIRAIEKAEEIHAEIYRLGLLKKHDKVLGTALVSMYAKCGVLAKAQEVFDELPIRDAVSWNALITGYAQQGLSQEALNCFGRMRDEGFSPSTVTFVYILKACGSIGATEMGKEIHAELHTRGVFDNHAIVLGNALVDMYAKCGMLAKAQEVFDGLAVRDVVSWTALISGYTQLGLGEEALYCYGQMRDEGFSPDCVTFMCILKACGSIGAIEKGEQIHAEVCRLGLLENHDIMLGTALVDMYAKCGALAKAQETFDGLPLHDTVSWAAFMVGYARLGKAERVFNLFNKMRGECIEPDGVTFSILLTACSHAGLVEEGQIYYDIMRTVYCIIPSSEHHSYLVDLFSRTGHFDKAISVIENVPDSDLALLGACRKWVNVELVKWAFEHVLQLDDKCAAAYVCMTNLFAAAGMQQAADKVEALRTKSGARKIVGRCWTDIWGNVHSFYAGDKSHPQTTCMYAKLKDIGQELRLDGYSPDLHWVSEEGKEDVLSRLDDKLAIACALINTTDGLPVRVTKDICVL